MISPLPDAKTTPLSYSLRVTTVLSSVAMKLDTKFRRLPGLVMGKLPSLNSVPAPFIPLETKISA